MQVNQRSLHRQLLDYLSSQMLLLVLDNGEYLEDAAILLNDILNSAPHLRLLVPSRQRLNQSAETVVTIRGLDYPAADDSLTTALQSSTVQLFMEAARRVQPNFEIAEETANIITEIGRLVDGMPLALELAASWLLVLSPAEIARAVERDLDILETDLADVPLRQRSIRAVFESTWQMLSMEQQMALMKLAVFQDGFTIQAAQQIAGADPSMLRALAARSLVERHSLDRRLEIHDLLRQYAWEYLEHSGRAEAAEAAHGHFFLAELARLEPDLKGQAQQQALDTIGADFGNILAAWKWAVQRGEFNTLAGAIESMFWYGMMRNRYQVMEPLFERTVETCVKYPSIEAKQVLPALRLRLWWMRRWREGSFVRRPEILRALEDTLAELSAMNQPLETGVCLLLLGDAAHSLVSDPARATDYLQQSMDVFQEQGASYYRAWSLHFLAKHASAIQGIGSSLDLQQQVVNLRRELGDMIGAIYSQYNLSMDLLLLGDLVACERVGIEMLEIAETLKENSGILMARTMLSLAAFLQGKFDDARTLNAANRVLAMDMHHLLGHAYALIIQGLLTAYEGDLAQASVLLIEGEHLATQDVVHFFAAWGQTLIDQDDDETLRQKLVRLLKYAAIRDADGAMVMCLGPCALREARWGSSERASGLLALALKHSADHPTWMKHWASLFALSEPLKAPRAEGQELRDLKATIQMLLRDYSVDEMESTQFPSQILAANERLIEPLSLRELEVLQAIVLGHTNQEIAAQLVVELSTIKKHITHIYDKLGVPSRVQAILTAQELGLVL
jgi:predicted ATPase/DNA-binding CsgD family transcriptional regulator